MLVEIFWKKLTGDPKSDLPPEIVEALKLQRWPGNIRQLKSTLSRLKNLFGKENLSVHHLESVLAHDAQGGPAPEGHEGISTTNLALTECIQHLRNIDEAVHAVFHSNSNFEFKFSSSEIVNSRLKLIETHLEFHLNELEMLFRRPLFFQAGDIFRKISRLKGKLNFFSLEI